MTSIKSRLFVPAVLGLLASGGGVFASAQQTWQSATVENSGLPSDDISVSGAAAVPLVPALGLVIAAAALAIIAASGRLRKIVGGLVIITAVIGIISIATGSGALQSAFDRAVQDSPAFSGGSAPQAQVSLVWPALAIGGFVLAIVVGGVIIGCAGWWATMGRRYDAPAAHGPVTEVQSDTDLWQAQDEGIDPTS